jgi:very-short-patch-repair endonuclease
LAGAAPSKAGTLEISPPHCEPSELARDKSRSEVLEACGFHIVRVSNTDVYDNLEGVLEMIEGTLRLDFRFD